MFEHYIYRAKPCSDLKQVVTFGINSTKYLQEDANGYRWLVFVAFQTLFNKIALSLKFQL